MRQYRICFATIFILVGLSVFIWKEGRWRYANDKIIINYKYRIQEKNLSVNEKRKNYIKKTCELYRKSINSHLGKRFHNFIYVFDKLKILFCAVPKTANTNFRRFFLSKSNSTKFGKKPERIPEFIALKYKIDKYMVPLKVNIISYY